MATPPTQASIKWVFESPYEGGTKTWSTRFYLTGGAWQDNTHFNTLADAIHSDLVTITSVETTIVEAIGYDPGSFLPVFTKAYGGNGSQTLDGPAYAPLEVCYLLRFTTDARSTKNHPIYLYNYIHNAMIDSATTPETPRASMHSAWNTRCNLLVAGYSDGTLTRKRCGPRGAVAQSGACEAFLTHRDFPR